MAYGPIGQTNGLTIFTQTQGSGAGALITQVQQSPGPCQLCVVSAGNVASVARFLKFYDTAVTPQSGASAIAQMIIPGNAAGAGTNLHISPGPPTISGLQFNQGLFMSVTQNMALADLSGTQGDTTVMLGYR